MASGPGIGRGTMCWSSGAGRISHARKRTSCAGPSVADTIYGMILLDQWLDPEEHPCQRSGTSLSHRTGRSRKGFGFYFAPGGH